MDDISILLNYRLCNVSLTVYLICTELFWCYLVKISEGFHWNFSQLFQLSKTFVTYGQGVLIFKQVHVHSAENYNVFILPCFIAITDGKQHAFFIPTMFFSVIFDFQLQKPVPPLPVLVASCSDQEK